ncbi:heavy metal translocating P-type ATPase, partial [Xanthobacter sp. VTT E-85237]
MTDKMKLDLSVILPGIPDAADACVSRLLERLRGRDGVDDAHVLPAIGDQSPQLCIHYDSDLLSLARIRELATGTGAQISARYGHAVLDLGGPVHQRRAR